jgi:raffinose/stachyose/melibiose transport system permease protein
VVEKRTRKNSKLFWVEILMILYALMTLYPVIMMVFLSLKGPDEAVASPFTFPKEIVFDNYRKAFIEVNYARAFVNSFILTFSTVTIGILLYSMAAYGLVRARRGQMLFMLLFYGFALALVMPQQMSLVPLTLLLKALHLKGTYLGVILVFIGYYAGFSIFLLHSFINTVPLEIEEAAIIDGCGTFGRFFKIMLPLLKPPIVTLIVYISIYVWNNFLFPLILLAGPESRTIPLAVYFYRGQFKIQWNLLFAALLLGILPILVFYFALQKKIVAGLTTGAVKG